MPITIRIDGTPYQFPDGTKLSIKDAAKSVGIDIPFFCDLPGTRKQAACRMCVVEVEGIRGLVTSCNTPIKDGMVIKTNTKKVRAARRINLNLLLANHPFDCRVCDRNGNCKLQNYCYQLGIRRNRYAGLLRKSHVDAGIAIVRDNERCILCGRCVRVCSEIQSVHAIQYMRRGFDTLIDCAFGRSLDQSTCISCGQCVINCPVGALSERYDVEQVWVALNEGKHVVIQAAPAVRVALGEEFGMPPGTNVTGKLYAAMKKLGFHAVFDTNFGADLTIMEEAREFHEKLIKRIRGEDCIPTLFTSCCPAWIKFVEQFYPDLVPILSTSKSPQMMVGSIAKTYYAEKAGIPVDDIVVVSVMPCTAKKFEAVREDSWIKGPDGKLIKPVDIVLTTREFARMIMQAGINFSKLPDEKATDPLAQYTGAGAIFGVSGGVMEAALRTAYYNVTGLELDPLSFKDSPVRGLSGIREATVDLNGTHLHIAVVSGMSNARVILDSVREQMKQREKGVKSCTYDFVEVMACPGGCINGGGQPIHCDPPPNLLSLRAQAIYQEDEKNTLRRSHENPAVKALYDTYLGAPGSEKAHRILHRTYVERKWWA